VQSITLPNPSASQEDRKYGDREIRRWGDKGMGKWEVRKITNHKFQISNKFQFSMTKRSKRS